MNGGFTLWSNWTECTETCGGGITSRTRTCTNPMPMYGGVSCSGKPVETKECNLQPCPPPKSEWSSTLLDLCIIFMLQCKSVLSFHQQARGSLDSALGTTNVPLWRTLSSSSGHISPLLWQPFYKVQSGLLVSCSEEWVATYCADRCTAVSLE